MLGSQGTVWCRWSLRRLGTLASWRLLVQEAPTRLDHVTDAQVVLRSHVAALSRPQVTPSASDTLADRRTSLIRWFVSLLGLHPRTRVHFSPFHSFTVAGLRRTSVLTATGMSPFCVRVLPTRQDRHQMMSWRRTCLVSLQSEGNAPRDAEQLLSSPVAVADVQPQRAVVGRRCARRGTGHVFGPGVSSSPISSACLDVRLAGMTVPVIRRAGHLF